MKVFAFTPTRAATPQRAKLLQSTIVEARKTAGCEFHWQVYNSGCSKEGVDVLNAALSTGQIALTTCPENVGQHVIWNAAYKLAKEQGASYFLRLDDDCSFPSKRWLHKMLRSSALFDDKFIISPTIQGLKNPPDRSLPCKVKDETVEFLRVAIGGICRLHPMSLIDGFVADVRKPMGSGDATGIGTWCSENTIPMVYLKHVRVKHAKTTQAQEAEDAEHFRTHDIFQHIPYIPSWRPGKESAV